ncbi:putative zinc finger, C2H2 type [Lyophyllum shimeji]|uniref:Zinc finger, C2H2 type n=1 Tax=Lyophyllum shimeji TaxID=47721 RepID=A0A9P3PJS9_LYOSH|nr:putative zinc finger, C2H2 type [Lyophyllum shimeji]
MQTQFCPPSFHDQDLYRAQSAYLRQETSHGYVSTAGLDFSGFSRGSSLSYPHQEYRHLDRGGAQARLPEPPSSVPSTSLCATGMAITGNPVSSDDFFQAEGIADFPLQEQWRWAAAPEPLHGLPLAPVPCVHPVQMPQHGFSTIKSGAMDYANEPSVVLSPAAQLPTPASMAVLLNPNAHSKRNSSQVPYQSPPASTQSTQTQPPPAIPPAPLRQACPDEPAVLTAYSVDSLSREKKHGCTMCHKRFDRPSTLKKHLLVHTGEKAFVCDTCGRRFGVASNLNRHVRRCILKPVNATPTAGKSPSDAGVRTAADSGGRDPSPSTSNTMSSGSSDHAGSPCHQSQTTTYPTRQPKSPSAPKRRRRAPSPSRWIPPSLLSFNLSSPESKRSTPVPLPPVRRNLPKEERDSWDENVASSPYHPRGWKNVLPGPGLGLGLGLGGKDVRNLSLGGNGGFMLGRVLVF